MLAQLDSAWSFVSSEDADFEVETQREFFLWIDAHPEATFLGGQPVLSFSKHLQVGLCGLLWHLQHDLDQRTGWSFIIRAVHPCSTLDSADKSPSPSEHGEFHNPFSDLLMELAHERQLSKQVNKLGFDCAENVENAGSFFEVLDALFHFSSWYDEQERDVQRDMEAEDLSLDCMMLDEQWALQCKWLEVGALEAAEMCQLAKSAVLEAAQAMAALLMEMSGSCIIRVHNGELWESSAPDQCLWAKCFTSRYASKHGFVLQWCTVEVSDNFAHCTLDLSELLVEESQKAAALSVGIAPSKPLTITFDNQGEVVRVSQELPDDEGSVIDGGDEGTMGETSCNDGLEAPIWNSSWVELDAYSTRKKKRKNQMHLGIQYLVRLIARQSVRPWSKRVHDKAINNVFVKTLQDVASRLCNLAQDCVICGAPRMQERPRLPGPCNNMMCESAFCKWQSSDPLELEELEMQSLYSLI